MTTSKNGEAAFVAKITASTTHEIRNVLAIVRESAGLIGDMVRAFQKRGAMNPERLTSAVDRIDAQVTRGAEIVSNLNRFAHSLDTPEQEMDVNSEVRLAASLCRRFAQQGRQTIEVVEGDGVQAVVAAPLGLQMALYWGIECGLQQLPAGGTLTIRTGQRLNGPAVDFVLDTGARGDADLPGDPGDWANLTEATAQVAAVVETGDPACHFRIVLPRGKA